MAHIQKLYNENGNVRAYKASIEVGSGKKRKRRYKTFAKSKDAQAWIANMITDKEHGTVVDPDNITVSQYFERFLETHKKPYVATTTYDNYVKRYEAHIKPDLGYYRLQDLQPFHLEEYFAKKKAHGRIDGKGGLSDNTLKKIYVLINQCFKKAKKFKLIRHNPLDPIDSPQPEKYEAETMSKKEFNKLLKTAKENDPFMFVFICTILYTGLRKSEALGLTWDNVDLDKGIIEVKQRMIPKRGKGAIIEEETKNKSSKRRIKISNKLCNLLKEHKKHQMEIRLQIGDEYIGDDTDLVFCKEDGSGYYPTSLNKKMKQMMEKANLPYNSQIHILRHTFATININNKIGPEVVQNMLGHSTIRTTIDIYYHGDIESQKEAVDTLDQVIDIDSI